MEKIDVCIITYNRLEYLKLCVWSTIASTAIDYRLWVFDDNSSDGTKEWLGEMKRLGKVDEVVINEENLGSAKTINKAVELTSSSIIGIISDDIWVHRGWDKACLEILETYEDCGLVSFWNYPIQKTRKAHKKINENVYKIQNIGVAGLMITRELYNYVGGYYLPDDLKMGYFSKSFNKKATQASIKRKYQYLTVPCYGEQMDRNNPGSDKKYPPKLSHEHLYQVYNKSRSVFKKEHRSRPSEV